MLTAVLMLFFFAFVQHWGTANSKSRKNGPLLSFEEVALKHGTDKVTTHKYQAMYDKYLRVYQGKPIKLLEIGLGCNMVCAKPLIYHLEG